MSTDTLPLPVISAQTSRIASDPTEPRDLSPKRALLTNRDRARRVAQRELEAYDQPMVVLKEDSIYRAYRVTRARDLMPGGRHDDILLKSITDTFT